MIRNYEDFYRIVHRHLRADARRRLFDQGDEIRRRVNTLDPVALFTIGLQVFTNPLIWLGILLLGLFFGLYLAALSWADLSFVLPVTSFGYAMNACAWRLLGEHVSITRWVGTLIICVGVATVSRTEQRTTSPEPGGAAI